VRRDAMTRPVLKALVKALKEREKIRVGAGWFS
jgi:hypothetical protein